MASGADHRLKISTRINLLRSADSGGSGVRVQVNAIGSDIEGDLSGTVDEDAGLAPDSADGLDDAGGEELELGEGQVSFTELDGVDAATRPFAGQHDQPVAFRSFVARQEPAVGNGVEQHQQLV
jgi:hypothetical protein